MLKEKKNVQQNEKDSFRRWFWSNNFDLIVWYDKQNTIIGFQLCYRKNSTEKALTWKHTTGFTHDSIDNGETVPTDYKKTPILVADGTFDKERILELFEQESSGMESELAHFLLKKISEY